MKIILLPLFLITLISTLSYGQESNWLQSGRKEFEKLYKYLDTIIDKPIGRVIAEPDTLSTGTWKGIFSDAHFGHQDITINITQTYPIVKGTLSDTTITTDSGPSIMTGELIGLYKDNHYILVWQLDPEKDILVFLEGYCFKVKDYRPIYTFMGNMAGAHEWDFTKGQFFLRKKY